MSKHTPGPWKISQEYSNDGHLAVDLGDGRGCVLIERHVISSPAHLEDGANALLIAAAPELLELAKKLHDAINCESGIIKGEGKAWEMFADLIIPCQAAIAKVEGK